PEELATLPGVAEIITDKRELPDLLGRFGVVDIPNGISRFGDRQRAYVKVQDGCLLRCGYCVIPYVRPSMHSRPMQPILDEVQRLYANGYREMVITGIHLGHYGVDWNFKKPKSEWTRLADLVKAIVGLPGDFRVRLSSIEAAEVTRELLDVMRDHPDRVCPHLHICLQSGSDSVLRRMRRRGGVKRFIDRCQLANERLAQPALTTDVIIGFPGETDREFAETCETVRECGFSKIHIFPFSARRGTQAAELTDHVSKRVQSERGKELAAVEAELRNKYFRSLLGKPLQVLIESPDRLAKGTVVGTSCRYAPVRLPSGDDRCGQFATVIAMELSDDGEFLRGHAASPQRHPHEARPVVEDR
ncbi:MAG: MiaB/RimO family radical SAM methylthiotransferase, partial [Planctomycetales bacterium]|nr:MiaB/RimO family radical SAM methylthiotransferase [Planctomycetales bacterium]